MYLIVVLLECPRINERNEVKLNAMAFQGLKLRNSVSLFSTVTVSPEDVRNLKQECKLYFNACSLFDSKVYWTSWHIGYAIPYYTEILYD